MTRRRRYVILAEGRFAPLESKTANQTIRYMPDQVVAVIDSRQTGSTAQRILGFGGNIPVVGSFAESRAFNPDTLLIGVAPTGGKLPDIWRPAIADALKCGVSVVSGLHTYIGDDPEFAGLAIGSGASITDLRKVPAVYETVAQGTWRSRAAKTILTVGTDCNVGKMTASYELDREFKRRGLRSDFVATGQTGMLLSGRGVAVDAVMSDYVAGAIEHEIDRRAGEGADFFQVEGQGSILHQGYSAVTLGLIHGVMPDAMVLVHHPARHNDQYGFGVDDLPMFIRTYEALVAPFRKCRVAAIAINTAMMTSQQAGLAIRRAEEMTGLPAGNVLTDDIQKLADAVIQSFGS